MTKDLSQDLIWRAISDWRCRESTAPHCRSELCSSSPPSRQWPWNPSVLAGNFTPPWAHQLISAPFPGGTSPSSCSWPGGLGEDQAPRLGGTWWQNTKGMPLSWPLQVTALRPGFPQITKLSSGLKDAKGSWVGERLANHSGEGEKENTEVWSCKISQNPGLSPIVEPRHSNSTVLQHHLFLKQKPRQDLLFHLLHFHWLELKWRGKSGLPTYWRVGDREK